MLFLRFTLALEVTCMVEIIHDIIAHLLPTLYSVAEAPADMMEQEHCPAKPGQPQNNEKKNSFKPQNIDIL